MLLKNIITDTHFDQRKRQGRLISFLANSLKNNKVIFYNFSLNFKNNIFFNSNFFFFFNL